ncbi:MAG: DUF1015 domain-containing protein [Ignavibacteriales bacterium]|nr:DUF1015 domain-containing protein [Ignavibacteriales bacterium]
MPEILPFKGLLYNQTKVNIDDVVAPPYDVISHEQQQKLYERNLYNVVRLILGREEDRYASAAQHFQEWMQQSILARDPKPALYIVCQTFTATNGQSVTRKGFIALCRLEEFDKKIVLPHEKTLAKPREDRLKLFKATGANFSQIFSLYSDSEQQIDRIVNGFSKTQPVVDVIFEDVQNQMWKLQDAQAIKHIQNFFHTKQVLIADGHHRYETALAYRDLMRSQNSKHTGKELYNYVMMFFTNIDDDSLVIYPTHRIVHSLNNFDSKQFLQDIQQHFLLREIKDEEVLMQALSSSPVRSFGLAVDGEQSHFLLTLKPTSVLQKIIKDPIPVEVKELDVSLLHSVILRDILHISPEAQEQKLNIDYVRLAKDAFQAVRSKKAQMAFLMNATKIEEIRSVAKAGYTMPQKSTYFYPKLLSGLVLNVLSE